MKAMIKKSGFQSYEESGSKRRIARWLLIVILVWGIPSAIFWAGLNMYLNDRTYQKSQEIYNDLDYQLDNFIHDSSPTRFFEPGFAKLFGQLKGLPSNPEILEKIVNEYKALWPADLVEIYLFNGENKLFPMNGSRPEHELFFRLVNSEFDGSQGVSAADMSAVGKFLPSPNLILSRVREQNGKVVEMGNPDHYSYCYFDRDKSINKGFVAGILIFVHKKFISTAEILNSTIKSKKPENFGFVNTYGQSNLPGTLENLGAEEILDYFQQYPVNSFELNNHLVSLKRFDEYVLLIGAYPSPEKPTLVVFSLMSLFLVVSFFLLRLSYRIVVLQIKFQHNVRQRLTGLFALCYALPLLAAGFLALQYMIEFRHSLVSNIQHENYRRLAEIDAGFNRFVTSKLLDLRKFSKQMQSHATDSAHLKKKVMELYQDFDADSVHLIASGGELICSTDLMTAEVRRHHKKSRQERQKILDSWKSRQAKLSDKHIQVLFDPGDENGNPVEPQKSEGHVGFVRLFRSTALSAMEFYNKSRGISLPIRRSSSNLVIDAIIESSTQSLFQSARTNISRFTNIQGMEEIFLAYLDVVAGPEKDAWYSFALMVDLVNYERQYLELLYSDLKNRSETMNKVFPEEDIRAVSNYHFAVNFPSVFEFKNFEAIIKRSSNDFKTFTQKLKIDGQDCLVSVVKASYLKHYLLIKILPMAKIEALFYERLNLILIFMLVIVIIGFALTRLLIKLFIVPINDIMVGVKALAARDYEHRIPVRSANAFGVLASSFNESAAILKKLGLSETIRKHLYPETEFRCGSYLISTANSNSRIILSDFFDYFPIKQGNYAIILAEVSGNDISAAYLTAMLKTSFTLLCPSFPSSPELILEKLNQIFLPYYQKGHLTTCFIGLIDPTNDRMVCANAGQSYPIAIGTGESHEKAFLSLPSTPLGINAETKFGKHEISLENKIIVLYSDGAVKISDHQGTPLGHDRFLEIVATSIKRDSRNPSEEIIQKLNEASMSVPWRDDITIMTIQNRI